MVDAPTGTYVVVHGDDAAPVLRDVETAQVHTLEDGVDVEDGEVLTASLDAVEPLEVTWTISEIRGSAHDSDRDSRPRADPAGEGSRRRAGFGWDADDRTGRGGHYRRAPS
ncbi:MAG: DUF5812 family protein [Natrialbaceae archaeon]|nr:DUF5812 family protein [Natrialbaceae archaeon]